MLNCIFLFCTWLSYVPSSFAESKFTLEMEFDESFDVESYHMARKAAHIVEKLLAHWSFTAHVHQNFEVGFIHSDQITARYPELDDAAIMIPIQDSDSGVYILWDRVLDASAAPFVTAYELVAGHIYSVMMLGTRIPADHPWRGAIIGRGVTLALLDLQRSPAFNHLSMIERAEVEEELVGSIENWHDVFTSAELQWMDCKLALVTDEPGVIH